MNTVEFYVMLVLYCSLFMFTSGMGSQSNTDMMYLQSFIYAPTYALGSCLKNNIQIYIKINIKRATHSLTHSTTEQCSIQTPTKT